VNKTATIKSESLSLDERIATALASPPTASAELLELLAEINAAVEDADEEARISRERSVDPRNLDGEALFEKADRATFWANRLNRSLTEIQTLYGKAVEAEQAAEWKSSFDRIRIARDQLSAEFSSRYQNIVTELVDLFGRIAKCDQTIDSLHATSPDGEGMRLRKVEAAARQIEVVDHSDSVLEKCQLPSFAIGHSYASPLAWPPAPIPVDMGLGFFPRSGGEVDADEDLYETVLEENTGFYVARRRADAPPLDRGSAPVPVSLREQALAEQAARAEERERLAGEGARRSW
jgi:hypothetical protein